MPVRVAVTCSNRKSEEVHDDLLLRNVPADAAPIRARSWLERVAAAEHALPARELYAGGHWTVARSIPHEARALGFAVELWTISAGLGLIAEDQQIPPYAATFVAGDADFVVPQGEVDAAAYSRAWWAALQGWGRGWGPRSLDELARQSPGDPLVVAVSPTYVTPLVDDIVAAAGSLDSPDLLTVVCAGGVAPGTPVLDYIVPADARLQELLGGSLVSLNARIAAYVVREFGPDIRRREVEEQLERVLDTLPPRPTFERERLTDDEVLDFISTKLSDDPDMARTPMLRALRSAGYACEQKRFKALYESVTNDDLNYSLF